MAKQSRSKRKGPPPKKIPNQTLHVRPSEPVKLPQVNVDLLKRKLEKAYNGEGLEIFDEIEAKQEEERVAQGSRERLEKLVEEEERLAALEAQEKRESSQ